MREGGNTNGYILRENIGLLQLPYEDEYYYDEEDINEGFLGFGKKKSRWQRFKDSRLAAALGGMAGLAAFHRMYTYGKQVGKLQAGREIGVSIDHHKDGHLTVSKQDPYTGHKVQIA